MDNLIYFLATRTTTKAPVTARRKSKTTTTVSVSGKKHKNDEKFMADKK